MSRSVEIYEVSIYTILAISIHFSSISLDSIWPLNFPNFSLSLKFTFSLNFQSLDLLLSSMILSQPLIMHFHIFWPKIWGFWKILGSFKFVEVFAKFLGWVCFSNDVKSSYIAFHKHFNYIVMHFRCVLYMLSCCMLVGLDWAKLMMYLNLHAYVSSFLYILIYYCVVTFLILSLSFSLSLSLSCISLLYGT